jgi:hypothetical protein
MALGKNVMIWGKTVKIIEQNTIAITNGHTPRKIVSKGTSGFVAWRTYTFIPTGGVIAPASPIRVVITPNHSGSYPSLNTIGNKRGMVSTMRASVSIKHPPIR